MLLWISISHWCSLSYINTLLHTVPWCLGRLRARGEGGSSEWEGCHPWLDGHAFEQTLRDTEGQEAWHAALHESQRVGYNLATEQQHGPWWGFQSSSERRDPRHKYKCWHCDYVKILNSNSQVPENLPPGPWKFWLGVYLTTKNIGYIGGYSMCFKGKNTLFSLLF